MKRLNGLLLCACLLCGCAAETDESVNPEDQTEAETPAYVCRVFDYYEYDEPVPVSAAADDAFFSDSIFAGDSRVGSLYLYSDLRNKGAEVYYATSVSLWRIYDVAPDRDSDKPLFDLLMDTERHNLYILIGINEIRYNDFETWGEEFDAMVDEILEKHPDDSLYLILNYQPRGLSNISDSDLWKHVEEENAYLKRIAEEKHVYYIDISDKMADEDGLIMKDLVWDGLHFNSQGAIRFADYLATHIVRKDNYVKEICE